MKSLLLQRNRKNSAFEFLTNEGAIFPNDLKRSNLTDIELNDSICICTQHIHNKIECPHTQANKSQRFREIENSLHDDYNNLVILSHEELDEKINKAYYEIFGVNAL